MRDAGELVAMPAAVMRLRRFPKEKARHLIHTRAINVQLVKASAWERLCRSC